MHDIICPDCGERFMGYEVVFDMSGYVLPLLYYKNEETEKGNVDSIKFKFYVDEELIKKSNKGATGSLRCSNLTGPSGAPGSTFPFKVTKKLLFEYVLANCADGSERNALNKILHDKATQILDKNNFSDINLNSIKQLYYKLFSDFDLLATTKISVEDENVKTALKILSHLYKNKEDEKDPSIFQVSIYSYNFCNSEKYYIPDVLFVRDGGQNNPLKKLCRYCGNPLPMEFGYYKMKPVVFWGSHKAGKTTYLLALLNAITTAPFNQERLRTTTLQDDYNLEALRDLKKKFLHGAESVKTDFKNVPILNLRVGDTIYSFIDWPGEAFISEKENAVSDTDFIYSTRPVISRAHHVFIFLPPAQISPEVEYDEKEVFDLDFLAQRLRLHFAFLNAKKIKSVTCIINKVDKLRGIDNAKDMFAIIEQNGENNFYNDATWNEELFNRLSSTTENYIRTDNFQLHNYLANIAVPNINTVVKRFYVPVAPQGRDEAVTKEDGTAVLEGFYSGLPFLNLLAIDEWI